MPTSNTPQGDGNYEPLQITFVADTPTGQLDVQPINIFERQVLNGEEYKQSILRACKYFVDKYGDKQ